MADEKVEAASGDNLLSPNAHVDPATDAGKGSSDTPEWMARLPESLRTPALAKFKDESGLAKSYLELEGKLGKSVTLPGKDAKDEEWSKFFDRAGRPKAADDYAMEPIEGSDQAFVSQLKGMFHAAGLTQVQAERLHKVLVTESVQGAKAFNEARSKAMKEGENSLREAWGQNYDAKLETARRFIATAGGEDAIKHLEALGVANDPLVIRLLAAAGEASGPHRFVTGTSPKGQSHPYDYMRKQIGQA